MADETQALEAAEAAEDSEPAEATSEAAEAAEMSKDTETEDMEAPQAVTEEAASDEASEAVEAAEAPTPETIEAPAEADQAQKEPVVAAEADEAVQLTPETSVSADELPQAAEIYYYGTGRRKTASAQVRLYPAKEAAIIVNDRPVDEYFSRPTDILHLKKPLKVTATDNMFRITVRVRGGGISGQAGAVRHGIARALTKANPELRPTLRKEGSLTRDPRMKERKKPGLKRARKAPQYTKR